MGPRPLLTPRLSLPGPLPSPESCRLPGCLALWNRVPQGQPRERPHPNPCDRPCPAVVRPRTKEEMEAFEKLQIQVRRDWRFHANISPPRGQAAARELPASAGGMQGAEEGPGGGPCDGSRGEGCGQQGAGSPAQWVQGHAGRCWDCPEPGRCRPASRFLPEPLPSAAVLAPVGSSCSVCPSFLLVPTRGASHPSLASWLSPDPPIVDRKMTRTLPQILGATTVPNTS